MSYFRMLFRSNGQFGQRVSQHWLSIAASLVLSTTSVYAMGLSAEEEEVALNLANKQLWQQNKAAHQTGPHPLNVQTLSVELEERKKGTQQRRAKVYQFNYHAQRSRLVLIDLKINATVSILNIDTVHLPLNNDEIATARTMVENDLTIMNKLNAIRLRRGLPSLDKLSTLEVKASIFEPSNPSHECAVQRCALLSLFDQTRTVFSVEPLVNLQSQTVTTLQQSL